jgi:hypothetical protein
MVQERNLERPKFQERDIDQRSSRPSVGGGVREGAGNLVTDTATGLALLFSIVSFFFSSVAVVEGVRARREVQAMQQATSHLAPVSATNSTSKPLTQSVALPGNLPPIAQRVEPNRFVEPVYGGTGQIELLSADRVSGTNNSNVVNLKMRVRRLNEQVQGLGDINLAQTVAINSRTNMRYPTLDFRSPSGNALSLYSLRPGQSADVTVMLRVPQELNRIDLQIPETVAFRGVPIAVAR